MRKCDGAGCPIKETCNRYTTEYIHYSEAFSSAPYKHNFDNCKYFISTMNNTYQVNDPVAFRCQESPRAQYGVITKVTTDKFLKATIKITKKDAFKSGEEIQTNTANILFKTR